MTTTATAVTPVALLGVGAAAPSLRLAAAEVAGAWGGGGRGTVAVCDADEDTLTLAWRAAVDALAAAGISAADLSGLWWATTRPPFAEGPSHAFLSTALGLDPGATALLCSGSPHAGMEALGAAWDALAAGHARLALVVASDALLPGIGTAGEIHHRGGSSRLRSRSDSTSVERQRSGPRPAWSARATRVMAVVDRYRGDARRPPATSTTDGSFAKRSSFPLMTAGAGTGPAETPPEPVPTGRPARWAIADPDGKLASAVAKRLAGPPSRRRCPRHRWATPGRRPLSSDRPGSAPGGPTGWSGHRLRRRPGHGPTVELARAVPGGSSRRRGSPRTAPVVRRAIRARGQLEPMSDPSRWACRRAAPPSCGATPRCWPSGARCRACGTISTPPSIHPACTGCGGGDLESSLWPARARSRPSWSTRPCRHPSRRRCPGGGRPRRRGPAHGAGGLGRRRRSGHRRRRHLVAAPLRPRAGHPRLRLQGVPGGRHRSENTDGSRRPRPAGTGGR